MGKGLRFHSSAFLVENPDLASAGNALKNVRKHPRRSAIFRADRRHSCHGLRNGIEFALGLFRCRSHRTSSENRGGAEHRN